MWRAMHPRYRRFARWSFLSNVVVSAQHVLATHSLLSVVSEGGNDTKRTLNYIGKDLLGQLGGIAYLAYVAPHPDQNPYRYIHNAHFCQQGSYLLLSSLHMVPTSLFLPLAGSASCMSNIAFIGLGAINAKCITHLSNANDTAAVYARISMINTLGSSVGMVLGLGMNVMVPDQETRLLLVAVLGGLRIYTYSKMVNKLL